MNGVVKNPDGGDFPPKPLHKDCSVEMNVLNQCCLTTDGQEIKYVVTAIHLGLLW